MSIIIRHQTSTFSSRTGADQCSMFCKCCRRALAVLLVCSFLVTYLSKVTAASEPVIQQEETVTSLNDPSKAEESLINKRFSDFLSGTSEFTEEKIEKLRHYLKTPGMPLRDLGFHEGMDDRAFAQGVLLSSFQFGESALLAIGSKDRKGVRRITLVEWPIYQEMNIPNRTRSFILVSGNSFHII